MALASRCFYHSTIIEFLNTPDEIISSHLSSEHLKSFNSLADTQNKAWNEEISILKRILQGRKGYICFEYNIPRMGKRIDVIVLIHGIIFILEFKAFKAEYTHQDIMQVCDYGLDLKNFHEESRNRFVVPILISTGAINVFNEYKCTKDRLFLPILANVDTISNTIVQYTKSICLQ